MPAIGISLRMIMAASGQAEAPAAPTLLTATADGGYTRINLAWTDNAGGTAVYRVYRSTDNVNFSLVDTTAAGQEWYTDSGLTRGQIYYYYVAAFEDSVESDPSNTANATVFALSDITLYAEYDANADVYTDAGVTLATDGQTVQEIHDQTGNGRHITQATAAAKPTLQTNELNALPVIRHASGDILLAATAADWKFLHDGTQFAAYIVWKATAADPNDIYVLMDTGAVSSGDTGMAIWYDDRVSVPRYDQVNFKVARAALPYEIDGLTPEEAAKGGEWHITAVRLDGSNGEAWNDGDWGGYDTAAKNGAPSASNPTSALAVGGRYNNTLNLVGDWARILIVSGAVTDANHQAIQDYLSEVYDTFEVKFFGSESVVEHDTVDPDWNGFPGICVAPNGNLVAGYSKGTTHAAGDHDLIVRISDDGGDTWGAEDIIWDYSTDGGGTDMWFTPRFTTIGTRIWMAVGKRVSGAAVVDGIGYFYSDDNGLTWTGPTQLTAATFTAQALEGGGIIELANGDYLYPYYGRDTGDATNRRSAAVLRSQDSGQTWSHLAIIADGPTDGVDYAEPGLVQIAGGNVIALLREDVAREAYKATSGDNGATWGATSYIANSASLNVPLLLDTGEIISCVRDEWDANRRARILFSGDDGDSWQMGWKFAISPNGTGAMSYGQMAQGDDGTVYCVYGSEWDSTSKSDVMFVKAE